MMNWLCGAPRRREAGLEGDSLCVKTVLLLSLTPCSESPSDSPAGCPRLAQKCTACPVSPSPLHTLQPLVFPEGGVMDEGTGSVDFLSSFQFQTFCPLSLTCQHWCVSQVASCSS